MQFHQLSRLPDPRSSDLQIFQEWLDRPFLGNIRLTGRDKDIWSRGVDLASIADVERSYPLTNWIADYFVPVFHRVVGRHLVGNAPLSRY